MATDFGGQVNFGLIKGDESLKTSGNIPVGASEVFKVRSGKFIVDDGAGRIEVADQNDNGINGWAIIDKDFTASSTEGADKLACYLGIGQVFSIPVYSGSTITEAALLAVWGTFIDLIVSSSYQYANIDASTKDHLLVTDVFWNSLTGKGYLGVMINPAKVGL